jgi:hypothetical protein
MKRSQIWYGLMGITFMTLAVITGCSRNLTVAPSAPAPTPTNTVAGGPTNTYTNTFTPTNTYTFTRTYTPTNTVPVNTNTFTHTPTNTYTFTSTHTGTHTYTFTNTHTTQYTATSTHTNPPGATDTFTNTPTWTGSPTATPTNTLSVPTNTHTATVTSTDTIAGATATFTPTTTPTTTSTNSPTRTNTAQPTPTSCSGTFQTAYTFDSNVECWAIDATASGAVVSAFNIATSPVTQGTGSLHIGYTEPATAKPIQVELTYATPANLAGRTLSAWIYVDANMTGSGVQFFTQSGGWATWTNSTGVYLDASKVGKWVSIGWQVPGTITACDQFGIQFYGMPTSKTGDIYIDNVSFSTVATPTNTPDAACTPLYVAHCETLTGDGTWGGTNSSFSISTLHATEGSNSLAVSIVSPPAGGWNDQFIQLSGLTTNTWANSTQLILDLYVDAAVLTGTTWNQMYLEASTGGGAWTYISTNHPSLVAGANSVTFNLDWTQGVVSTDPLDMMVIVLQTGGQSGSANVYLDNVRAIIDCSAPSSTNTPTLTPTVGNTSTFTSTAIATSTPTVTMTPTVTLTSTITDTTIPGATDTFTFTVTATPTVTATSTNTLAATATLTNTPTTTATNTTGVTCPVAAQNSYTFDSSIGCWQTSNQLTTTTVGWATGPTGSPSGGGAFRASVAYSAVTQLTEEFEVALPDNTDLTNKILTFRIYIDNAVKGTAWGGGLQFYTKSGAAYTFCNKSWENISGFGGWYKYTMDLSSVCATASDVRAFGVQVIIAEGGGSGYIYIDDVTVTDQPTPTFTPTVTETPGGPTSTPTATFACPLAPAAAYSFDSNIGCWTTSNQLLTTVVGWATGPAGSDSGGGAYSAAVAYSAVSQLTEELELPLPDNTDLTGKVVTFNMYIDNAVKGTAWGGGVQAYVKTGAAYDFCNKSWTNISGFGGWYPYTIDLSTDCSTGVADTRAIGLQVIIAAGGGSGNIYLDDVTIQ